MALALLAVAFAARFPASSEAASFPGPETYAFSGLGSSDAIEVTALSPGTNQHTNESVVALTDGSTGALVRSSAGISPNTSISSGVIAAAAVNGENNGTTSLADLIDPRQPYALYTTQEGDTVSGIASHYGITIETLLDNNPEVSDQNLIEYGQQLIVPRADGILHKVGFGETLESIVNQYDTISVDTVVSYRPNALGDGSGLAEGQFVLLPGATRKPPPPPPIIIIPTNPGNGGNNNGGGGGGGGGGGSAPPPASGGMFGYPLGAWLGVSDWFGSGRGYGRIHEGIDLDLFGYWHSPIYSACSGTVIKTEYLTYSYGYHVVVDCGGGFTTLYAHMSEISVSPGQYVSMGTVLGYSGVTGATTGEHLHFEIRYFGAPLNPANYLNF